MQKEKKEQIINRVADDLSRSEIIIATNYQGLTAKQMTELRRALVKAGGEYHVIKNTLARIAAKKAGKESLLDMIDGPVALAFGYGNAVALVRVLNQYIRSTESLLKIRAGLLGERIMRPEEVVGLTSLPSKEVLVSQLIAWLQVPVIALRDVVSFPLQGLITILQSRKERLGENK